MEPRAASCSGIQCSALKETTRSNSSWKGRQRASATSNRRLCRVAGPKVRRAKLIMSCDGSTPDYRTPRDARGDFRGDLSIAASDIKDPLRALKIEQSEYFLSHRFLQRRAAIVLGSIPFCHVR